MRTPGTYMGGPSPYPAPRPPKDPKETVVDRDTHGFALKAPSQVTITANGQCSARNAYAILSVRRTTGAGLPETVVSQVDVDCSAPAGYSVGASLWLGPGNYEWRAELILREGGTFTSSTPLKGTESIVEGQSFVGGCSASGARNGYVTVVVGHPNTLVKGSFFANASLLEGEYLQGDLRFFDNENIGLGTPAATLHGPSRHSLNVEGLPLYLPKPFTTYTFCSEMTVATASDVRCTVSSGRP